MEYRDAGLRVVVAEVSTESDHFEAVIDLWRRNSQTLGMLPRGAFEEHARKGGILGAISEWDRCVGYLLFYVAQRSAKARIIHLCVDPVHRGQGIAHALFQRLKKNVGHLKGIELKCRRDYDLARFWESMGFVAVEDLPGRGSDGAELTVWWFDNGHPTLFSLAAQQRASETLVAAIDANVLFDLQDASRSTAEESQALLADWVQGAVSLWVTKEVYSDMNRCADSSQRQRRRRFVDSFPKLSCPEEEIREVGVLLERILPEPRNEADRSDMRHLAISIASGAQYFVTHDSALLRHGESIVDEFGMRILTPSTLVICIDELSREEDYRPVRLAGSASGSDQLVTDADIENVIRDFQVSKMGERQTSLRRKLRSLLADPQGNRVSSIKDSEGEFASLICLSKRDSDTLEVPVFRIREPLGRSLAASGLARYLIQKVTWEAIRKGVLFTLVTEPYLSRGLKSALRESGFFSANGFWARVNLPVVETSAEIAERLSSLDNNGAFPVDLCAKLAESLIWASERNDKEAAVQLERLLWPAKIVDNELSTFIISVEPRWALHLFDETMASQNLFGSKLETMLSCENIYYRRVANTPHGFAGPARILWYVSQDKRYQGTQRLRACSYLDEVIRGKPKRLYRRFSGLGIYEWIDVLRTAGLDLEMDIMALRFSDTESFTDPIPWSDATRIIAEEEGTIRQLPPLSPMRISHSTFLRLYELGMKTRTMAMPFAHLPSDE